MKKIILMVIMVLSVTMISNVKVFASDVTPTEDPSPSPTPEVNAFIKFDLKTGGNYSINAMMDYYHNVLDDEQKKIAKFLLGSYNYMYMTARGMSYENINTLGEYIQKFFDVADLVFGVDFVESNTSRWNENFRIFISSIISYAGNVYVDFDTWLSDIAPNLLIPYSEKWLDAWTTYYSDPTNEGVADFGSEERDWVSGINYEYLYGDTPFYNSDQQTVYYEFVLNDSPILYSNSFDVNSRDKYQYAFSFKDKPIVDTLYVQRGNVYQYFRFGDYQGNFYNDTLKTAELRHEVRTSGTKVGISVYTQNFQYNNAIISYGPGTDDLGFLIEYAFDKTPIVSSYTVFQGAHGYYPFVSHVVLVDDLNTLSNRQDVYNDFTLGILTSSPWIKRPGTDLPYWWKPIDFDIEIEEPSGDLRPAEGDDFDNSIVNNTVINNYDIIAPGVVINVPQDWLSSDGNYLAYTNETALPFFVMVGDIFLALGELRIFIIACLILGLVGGILVKFLL